MNKTTLKITIKAGLNKDFQILIKITKELKLNNPVF